MARRRRRQPDIIEIIGPILGLIFLLLFLASGFNIHVMAALVQGLFALVILVVFVMVGGFVLFLVIRFMIRARRAGTWPFAAHSGSPSVPNFAPSRTIPPFVAGKVWRLEPQEQQQAAVPAPPTREEMIEKLRASDWYQFEKVVGLVYQSQGYRVSRRGGAKPDGGIDLIIEQDGVRAAVQCKRWKKWKVDVPKVRELFGAMTHEGLPRGVIVTLNGFTLEAKQLAVEHNIDILHDENFATMIAGLAPADQLKVQAMLDDTTKHCPKCEATMVWRTPQSGKNWTPFWGCSRYPQCHGRLQDD
jgi:hypothetical protein